MVWRRLCRQARPRTCPPPASRARTAGWAALGGALRQGCGAGKGRAQHVSCADAARAPGSEAYAPHARSWRRPLLLRAWLRPSNGHSECCSACHVIFRDFCAPRRSITHLERHAERGGACAPARGHPCSCPPACLSAAQRTENCLPPCPLQADDVHEEEEEDDDDDDDDDDDVPELADAEGGEGGCPPAGLSPASAAPLGAPVLGGVCLQPSSLPRRPREPPPGTARRVPATDLCLPPTRRRRRRRGWG